MSHLYIRIECSVSEINNIPTECNIIALSMSRMGNLNNPR